MSKKCVDGHVNDVASKFCATCGAPLNVVDTNEDNEPSSVEDHVAPSSLSTRVMRGLSALGLRTKLSIGALVLTVIAGFTIISVPHDGSLADKACSDAAISKTKSPTTSSIVESASYGPVRWENDAIAGIPEGTLSSLTEHVSSIDEALSAAEMIVEALKPVKNSAADGFYIVLGALDGTNGFGATVRNHWVCVVQVGGFEIRTEPKVSFLTN